MRAARCVAERSEFRFECNDKVAAAEALRNATSEIEKAVTKGVYHKNTAARKISRLALAANKLA